MEEDHAPYTRHFTDAPAGRASNAGNPAAASGGATVGIDPHGARVGLGIVRAATA